MALKQTWERLCKLFKPPVEKQIPDVEEPTPLGLECDAARHNADRQRGQRAAVYQRRAQALAAGQEAVFDLAVGLDVDGVVAGLYRRAFQSHPDFPGAYIERTAVVAVLHPDREEVETPPGVYLFKDGELFEEFISNVRRDPVRLLAPRYAAMGKIAVNALVTELRWTLVIAEWSEQSYYRIKTVHRYGPSAAVRTGGVYIDGGLAGAGTRAVLAERLETAAGEEVERWKRDFLSPNSD